MGSLGETAQERLLWWITPGVRLAGKIVYFLGYSRKGPDSRLLGYIPSSLLQIGVLGFLFVTGGRTLLGA